MLWMFIEFSGCSSRLFTRFTLSDFVHPLKSGASPADEPPSNYAIGALLISLKFVSRGVWHRPVVSFA
ncbi:hypothetical protein EVAR_19763_1 [Eumeta japonica]|uniref:Uncharacterized protein n=1 Tax=Eumeta variegata TaxID=151549 RepID=A0A4C1UQK8_EUMVA|nr:hypothetical protein EVAR_19763_1 [Eumeta japonica]